MLLRLRGQGPGAVDGPGPEAGTSGGGLRRDPVDHDLRQDPRLREVGRGLRQGGHDVAERRPLHGRDFPDGGRLRPRHHPGFLLQSPENEPGRPYEAPDRTVQPHGGRRLFADPRLHRRLGLLDGRVHLVRQGGDGELRRPREREDVPVPDPGRDLQDQSERADHRLPVELPALDEDGCPGERKPVQQLDFRPPEPEILRRLCRLFREVDPGNAEAGV